MHNLAMDPLAVSAEIATLLQAASEAVPPMRQARVANEKRQEAYFEFLQEGHRLMGSANHLRVLAQIETISWKTGIAVAMPMVSPFLEFLRPKESSKYRLWRELKISNGGRYRLIDSPAAG